MQSGVGVGLLLFAVSLVSLGCGGSPTAPLSGTQTVASDLGTYTLHIDTSPDPAIRGVNSVTYTITDKTGTAVDGLMLQVVPWMPSHGHGTSVQPTVISKGMGVYEIDNVLFFMPGHWELRTAFMGSSGDHVTPTFDIP
jgi:hypothetical protein